MATATAPPPQPPRTRPDPTRRLWQVPTFLLGVTAFVCAWQGWLPLAARDPAAGFLKDLATLKSAGERLPADVNELKAHIGRVAATAESFPEHTTAIHYALGSAYIRLAEVTANPEEAAGWWEMARQHFAHLKPGQFDSGEQPRYTFRSTKLRAAFLPPNTPPAEIDLMRHILVYTPVGEEAGESQRLAAELALRLNPPDLRKAKEALAAYVGEAGLQTPQVSLTRARLRLSEVQLMLGEPDAARKWLVTIGPDAPPDVLGPAKAQLARILMAERNWEGAIQALKQVHAAPGPQAGLKSAAAYFLGYCHTMTRPPDPAQAAPLFEEAARADGPEGPAAKLRLAELYLGAKEPARHREAVPLLAAAVKGVSSPADYANVNPLVPINETQAAFELAVQVLIADGSFDAAVTATEAFGAVAVAGRDREKRAEALTAWAVSLPQGSPQAKEKFTAAAEGYVALAEVRPADTDKADLLRRAAGLYRQAGNSGSALAALEKILTLRDLTDEVAGPVWVEYADSLLAANRPDEALKAFNGAMRRGGPASTAARYRVARLLIDSRDPRKAPLGMALLQQIAEAERVGPSEQEVHERALVELAHESIRAGNFADAEVRLRMQLNRYPTGPEAGLARLLLGICLLQRATPPKPGTPEPAKATAWREEALKLFKDIIKEVDAKKKATGKATERDDWLRVQAGLRVLKVYEQMGKPYDVLTEAAPLLVAYKGTVEELIVRSLMYHAYKQLNQPENALRMRDEMRAVFNQLKTQPGAFKVTSGEYSREYWEKTWFSQ